jgi:hypothetical protein
MTEEAMDGPFSLGSQLRVKLTLVHYVEGGEDS